MLSKERRDYLWAIGGVAVLLWVAAFEAYSGEHSQQAPPYNCEQPTSADNQNHQLCKAVIGSRENKKRSEGNHESPWYGTFKEHTAEWLIAIFNGLLVYVTYRLVTTTGDLRRSTDKLWEAGEKQIDIAGRAASAAQRSADYLRNAERPYLLAIKPMLRNFDRLVHESDQPKTVEVRFKIENIGKGGGFLKGIGIAHEICLVGKQGSIEPTSRTGFGSTFIDPGATRDWSDPFDVFEISDADRDDMVRFWKSLYVYGYFQYSDFFQVTRETGFIFEFVPDREVLGHGVFIVCPHPLWYDREVSPNTKT